MPEYRLSLQQDTGASILIRLSPNNYADYSINGTVWYPMCGDSGNTGDNAIEAPVDGETIKVVNGTLVAVQELPPGGVEGQVLTKTDTGIVWKSVDTADCCEETEYKFGAGLIVGKDKTVSVDVGSSPGKIVALGDDGKVNSKLIKYPDTVSVLYYQAVAGRDLDCNINIQEGVNTIRITMTDAHKASKVNMRIIDERAPEYRNDVTLVIVRESDGVSVPVDWQGVPTSQAAGLTDIAISNHIPGGITSFLFSSGTYNGYLSLLGNWDNNKNSYQSSYSSSSSSSSYSSSSSISSYSSISSSASYSSTSYSSSSKSSSSYNSSSESSTSYSSSSGEQPEDPQIKDTILSILSGVEIDLENLYDLRDRAVAYSEILSTVLG